MRRLQLLLLILSSLSSFPVLAQVPAAKDFSDKPLRVEIPARSVNETYRVIPCGTKGMILFFRSQEIADETRIKWYFSLYDTNLQLQWVKNIPLLNDMEFRFQQSGADTLALLFLHTGKTRGTENDFQILRIVPGKGTMILNAGKINQDAEVVAFGLQKGRGWLGCNMKGQAGKILNIKLSSGLVHGFPLGQGTQIGIKWMQPDSVGATVSTVVSRPLSKKSIEQYLVRYDTAGLIKSEILIGSQDFSRDLTHVIIPDPSASPGLVMGSYGEFVTLSGQKNKVTDASAGFFTSTVANGAQKSLNFYNFLEMSNANSLLTEREIMNLKKKALRKNKTLSEYSLDLSILLHGVYPWQEQLILVAEVFSPQYHTESFTDFDYYGRPYTNSFSVFDGYRFYNTIIVGFDKSGKMLWDNTFEIRNLVSLELSPKVVLFPSQQDLVLCYVSDGMVGTKIIHENRVVEKTDFGPVDLLYPDEKLISESKAKLISWYGNYFITYGYQEIKNIALATNNKRLVFYFSKLRFDK
ncbi:MAG: hypothetical protein WCO44_02665 [Bacteroidota bacterium]